MTSTKSTRPSIAPRIIPWFSLVLLLCLSPQTNGQTTLDAQLHRVAFEQHLGATISPDLQFRDESNRAVRLETYLHQKPIILVPGYYSCPMLCGAMANGLVNALRDLPLSVGKDFIVLHISINPKEDSTLATAKKQAYLRSYGHPESAADWHLLTGDAPAIQSLTRQIGFHFFYDPGTRQYAHPSGLVILTPEGKISSYVFGVNFPTADLLRQLKDAKGSRIGSPLKALLLLCFHYQPVTGRYAAAAFVVLRATALALVLALGIWVIRALRSDRQRTDPSST